MKTIKFVKRAVFERFGRNHPDNPRFDADQVETMRNDQADRWIERGAAVLLEDHGDELAEAFDDGGAEELLLKLAGARASLADTLKSVGA